MFIDFMISQKINGEYFRTRHTTNKNEGDNELELNIWALMLKI